MYIYIYIIEREREGLFAVANISCNRAVKPLYQHIQTLELMPAAPAGMVSDPRLPKVYGILTAKEMTPTLSFQAQVHRILHDLLERHG